ncbi:MAG: hypothetical protein WA865_17735 [Spirulinaceae cyanobacterium]
MSRLLYEKSLSYQGHLIIPFVFTRAAWENIYSYALLSERGYKGEFHKAENPAKLYSSNITEITDIAKEYLQETTEESRDFDYFQNRYTYQDNLIIIHQQAGKCFYDHYPPQEIRNVAAPKIFFTPHECLTWVKQGLDKKNRKVGKVSH